jgi:hypothetical protein
MRAIAFVGIVAVTVTACDRPCYAMDLKANPADRPGWKMFEADNGAVYALNVQSVSHPRYCGGCADAVICVLDKDQCHAPNVKQIRFDCQGHYMDMFGGGGMQIAPPHSVLGQVAVAVCIGEK